MRVPLHRLAVCAFVLAASAGFGRAQSLEPVDLIPADALMSWQARLVPGDLATLAAGDQPSALQTLLEIGARVAGDPLNRSTELNLRMAELLRQLLRYPYAVALIDTSAKPLATQPHVPRVDRLRFAAVAQCRGQSEPFLRIIQKAVNEQTSSGTATLAARTAGKWSYQELRDTRLPDWAAIAWGTIEDCFVLTVGPDVWPALAACAAGERPSLAKDPWYAPARAERGAAASIEIFLAADLLQQRLDPVVDDRVAAFFKAWHSPALERAYWALGFEGRALFCEAHLRQDGRTRRRVFADPTEQDARWMKTIPASAQYAVFRYPINELLPQFLDSLLVIQGPKVRAQVERMWAQIQREHGFDAERDLLAHFGDHIVMHNDPPHPLGLPVAVTLLVEIRDDPASVRRGIAALGAAWQDAIRTATRGNEGASPVTLERDGEDVWYLRLSAGGPAWLGLAGPAWTVTDRFLVISWSPFALRDYLDRIGDAAGQHVPAPTSQPK